MGYFQEQKEMGIRIYGLKSWREKRRIFLFLMRSLKNKKQIDGFHQFFANYKPLPHYLDVHYALEEDINRVFFYKGSTAQERLEKIENHFNALPVYFKQEALEDMYMHADQDHGVMVWKNEDLAMEAKLLFISGQRKEGLLTLLLTIEGEGLYHINFRFDKDPKTGETYVLIGTLQGYQGGLAKAKKATKKMYGYRPKNFICYLMRLLVQQWGIQRLDAISDEGFYTNNHTLRFNRSKKVQFDPFWEELGGHLQNDSRFFSLPIEEERKPIEEVKSQKRSQYRNRYAMMDQVAQEVADTMALVAVKQEEA